jgi:DNA mismatch repair protein MutS
MPKAVVNRANEILKELEAQGSDFDLRRRGKRKDEPEKDSGQLALFSTEPHPVIEELRHLRIEEMSPIDAMTKLYELQRMARHE